MSFHVTPATRAQSRGLGDGRRRQTGCVSPTQPGRLPYEGIFITGHGGRFHRVTRRKTPAEQRRSIWQSWMPIGGMPTRRRRRKTQQPNVALTCLPSSPRWRRHVEWVSSSPTNSACPLIGNYSERVVRCLRPAGAARSTWIFVTDLVLALSASIERRMLAPIMSASRTVAVEGLVSLPRA
jgi:hypothetical protein